MDAFAKSLIFGIAIAASTMQAIAHPSDFMISTSPEGIVVDRVNKHGFEPIPGSPFVPSPVPGTITPLCLSSPTPQPSLLSLDQDGKYLYALYETDGCLSIYSFQLQNGVPYVVSPFGYFVGAHGHAGASSPSLVVSKHFVFVLLSPRVEDLIPTAVAIFGSKSGVLDFEGIVNVADDSSFGFPANPISIQVDEAERYLYLSYQGTIGTFGNCTAVTCVAILHIAGPSGGPSLIATIPAGGSFQITTH